jgi:hypothetical protein
MNIDQYLLDHYGTKRNVELVEDLKVLGVETTCDAIRNRWYNLNKGGIMARKPKNSSAKKREAFKTFLLKGRTEKEIIAKFGDLNFLKEKFEGLNLFTQRNNYHELIHILLPVPPKGIKLLPKKYTHYVGKDDKGNEQPYLLVQIPDFKGKLIIAPLFDIHYGHATCNFEKFMSYVRWIRETPNVYAILGGDVMENALDDGRGMTYDQSENPQTQLDRMTEILSTIAHKILVSTPGNHEARTKKKTGLDVAQVLAERLKVPYFNGPVTMSIVSNTYKWTFYVFHGFGNSQTKGGKMNVASRPKGWTGLVHFFVSGHTHDCIAESETAIIEDPLNCRLMFVKQWTVVAQAFLGWYGSYGYEAGYKPPAQGGVSIELFADGTYRAALTE